MATRGTETASESVSESVAPDPGRRASVLASAVQTFAHHGYRATSMEAVARDARISRQGLYFLFGTKEALFREAVSRLLTDDLRVVEELLSDVTSPLAERLLAAYDRWSGRWVGPLARDVPGVVADNPDLLDEVAHEAPVRFHALVREAVAGRLADPDAVVRTLSSVSLGLKHQVDSRDAYREGLRTAIRLLVPTG